MKDDDAKEMVIERSINNRSNLSPTPAYSDKFGKLKKSEALEVLFNNLNRQLRAMKAYFS